MTSGMTTPMERMTKVRVKPISINFGQKAFERKDRHGAARVRGVGCAVTMLSRGSIKINQSAPLIY
jgi:hypothetical protein